MALYRGDGHWRQWFRPDGFLMTQWAHRRGAPRAETLAGYDAAYVGLPVLLIPAAAGQSGVNLVCLLGLAVIGVGLFLLTRKSVSGFSPGQPLA
jgi:hypothetical protein